MLDLADESNWSGGFYELAIELGQRDDARLEAAIGACWSAPGLRGCWPGRDLTGEETVAPSLRSQEEHGHLAGLATIDGLAQTICGTVLVREDESGIDWLDFYLPVGALDEIDARCQSLWDMDHDTPYEWRLPIHDFLAHIAERVHVAAPFELALIGWEVSGALYRSDLELPATPRPGIALIVPMPDASLTRVEAASSH